MIYLRKFPIYTLKKCKVQTNSLIIRLLAIIICVASIFSLSAWLSVFFQTKTDEGRYHTHIIFAEIYVVFVTLFTMFLAFCDWHWLEETIIVKVLAFLFLIELFFKQFDNIILRPALEKGFKPYMSERTLLLALMQYFNIIFVFAFFYRTLFQNQFVIGCMPAEFGVFEAIEFSIITMTTVGFGSVHPVVGSGAAIAASLQGIIGVFYIAFIIAVSVSRLQNPKELAGS